MTGTSSSLRRLAPNATAAASRNGSRTATPRSSTSGGDPGGHAALGFRRSAEPPHVLEVDPATIGTAVGLFERYALGTVSSTQLAEETGLNPSRIRCLVMNPLFNGWIRRHRGPNETRRPAAWRSNPPVSDQLWARVEDVRRSKTRGGGAKRCKRVDLLGGPLECVCGRRLRSDGRFADGRYRKLHAAPCEAWGRRARLGDETWEGPLLAQLAGIRLDNATIASVVAALGSAQRPVAIDRARVDRQIRELALEHAAGGLHDNTYLGRLKELRGQRDAFGQRSEGGLAADRAVEWLRVLGQSLKVRPAARDL